jgi:Gpi18-like mannosyltransferase
MSGQPMGQAGAEDQSAVRGSRTADAPPRDQDARQPLDGGAFSRDGCGPSMPRRWRVWVCATIAGSVLLRMSVLRFESRDYTSFLSRWYDFIVQHGRWHALGQAFSSYPPLYLYLLSLTTFLPVPKLYAVKSITLASDYVAALYVWALVRRAFRGGRRAWFALTAFLFLPTVVLNGAVWGQCDVMYAGCFLASLYYLLERRRIAALVAFGLACSLKPQAIFWCPLLAGLLLSGELSWRRMWVPVAVYVSCGVPQMLAGRPVLRTIGHWATVRNYPGLVLGAPNWYQWAGQAEADVLWCAGVALTLWATALLALWIVRTAQGRPVVPPEPGKHKGSEADQRLVSLALLSVLFPPFLLPGMHERYFFAADVLSLVYAFYVRGGWKAATVIQFASAFAYLPYLFNVEPIPLGWLAGALLLALGLVVIRLLRSVRPVSCKAQPGGTP